MKRLLVLAALILAVGSPANLGAQSAPAFKLGFKLLADQITAIVGQPIENEWHNAQNGDALQRTTTGLMVWRKADNWTAFTDGSWTWINGPYGVQSRLNGDRFTWEAPAPVPAPPQPAPQPTAPVQPAPQSPVQPAPVLSTESMLDILSITSPVKPGDTAQLVVSTSPGLAAVFVVNTESGPVFPAGPHPEAADCGGKVFWTWIVDSSMPAGTWPVVVTVETPTEVFVKETNITVYKP